MNLPPTPSANDSILVLEKFIADDTSSRNSNRDLVDFIRDALVTINLKSRLTFNLENTNHNPWTMTGQTGRGAFSFPDILMLYRWAVKTGRLPPLSWSNQI